mmetsp:Transcript_14834/g.21218  ORF Transcript_14834/g.21218 Transcript_14834/m.21218 type:complete len:579 (-) Transcript_14834:113-1849(-)|eukprot:CAMPEP_0184862524 /NCGR_PEP_ID=MMETSP0580-20130426/6989_1 /TAXON_ID=1118495 /ORGANISM="Dactyliosolen fragilissimus" /LENGTH=578 /DNA_ID=CAMNT_0027360443 /DNA_START=137 /DNA_END=1873 /DNA_ORIENTATION=+
MVKHQKEKQYQSASERRRESNSNSANSTGSTRRLPFDHCALSLVAYKNPVCTRNGIIYEMSAVLSYILKHKHDPATGNKMKASDLIKLKMEKDDSGRWMCPVLDKPFGNNTKVVAVVQNPPGEEANVYSFEAVQELNFKTKNYEDLTTGKPFNKNKDVIILQDPANRDLELIRDINNFTHVSLLRDIEKNRVSQAGVSDNVNHSVTGGRIMEQIRRKREEENEKNKTKKNNLKQTSTKSDKSAEEVIYTNDLNGVKLTTGKTSGSLTSTAMDISNTNAAREATKEEILDSLLYAMKKLKQKGFVRMITTLGDMDFELHCDIAPRTCINFIGLAEKGAYNGTKFHRSIPNFMIQGGKPINGEKEESFWGDAFEDEFDERLKHNGIGILSMANSGPRTNKRQFFITYKSAPHLDRKHSVFGRIAAGTEVLRMMEHEPTGKKDKPLSEIKIIKMIVFENPVEKAKDFERNRISKNRKEREEKEVFKCTASASVKSLSKSNSVNISSQRERDNEKKRKKKSLDDKNSSFEIGKYIPAKIFQKNSKRIKSILDLDASEGTETIELSRLPPPPKKTTFGNFSAW